MSSRTARTGTHYVKSTTTELHVTCWCDTSVRLRPERSVLDGTAGWSCGRPGCRDRRPAMVGAR